MFTITIMITTTIINPDFSAVTMLLAESLSGLQLILLGLSILTIAFVLRRSLVLGKRSRKHDPDAEDRRDVHNVERTSASQIHKLEMRLHDYGREMEGRMQTRLAMLDQLIADADCEIERLQSLLQQSRHADAGTGPRVVRSMQPGPDIVHSRSQPLLENETNLTAEQRRMIGHLQEAGYSVAQIARLIDRTEADVQSALQDDRHHPSDGARRQDAA